MKNRGALSEVSCNYYLFEMKSRFSENEFTNPMFKIVSLKQTNTVEEYYDEFKSLLNLIQLLDDYALSIFISNLKHEISNPVRLFYPKTITHALNLAKQLESLAFNIPKKPYTAYKNPPNTTQIYTLNKPPPKTKLPPLLPTPKNVFPTY